MKMSKKVLQNHPFHILLPGTLIFHCIEELAMGAIPVMRRRRYFFLVLASGLLALDIKDLISQDKSRLNGSISTDKESSRDWDGDEVDGPDSDFDDFER